MDSERLWAPWRMAYVAGDRAADAATPEPTAWRPGADRSCFLCRAASEFADDASARRQLLVVSRGNAVMALLNRFPYNNGHLLVSPLRHVADLAELTAEEHLDAMATLARFTKLYSRLLQADGFNVGLNLGRPAGAGVPGHLHWHLVPRWSGDNNFMPVAAGTRIISQALDELWAAIEAESN